MTKILKQVNLVRPGRVGVWLEKLGIFSFLLFFLLTPLLIKLKVADGVYVEPLLPFLALGAALILCSMRGRSGLKGFLRRAADFLFPNTLSVLYPFLILLLLISYFYGWALTGLSSPGDLLRIIKFSLYFLPFPMALYVGKRLGSRDTETVLKVFVAVGVAAAVASFIRVFDFLFSGRGVDLWAKKIYRRSVGFLGQYFDPLNSSFGLTGKSANGTFGIYSSVVLATCLSFVSRVKKFKSWNFVLILISSTVLFGAILYALSRGAAGVGSLVVVAWVVWFWRFRRFKVIFLSLLFLFISSFAFISLNHQVLSKLTSTFRFEEVMYSTDLRDGELGVVDKELVIDQSTMGRLDRWGKIFKTFERYPLFMLSGVGYHTKNLIFFSNVSNTHSLFLDIWVRGGLIASGVLTAVWFLIFGFLSRIALSRDKLVRALGFTLLGFSFGWFLDNLISGEQFFSDAPMIAFWGVLGFVESLRQAGRGSGGPKKVLIALTSSEVGGAPKVVYDLLNHVGKKGQVTSKKEFEFIVAAPKGPFVKKFRGLGYKVYPVPLDRIGIRGFIGLLRVANKEKVDLINSHGKGAGIYARKVGVLMGIPVIQTFHGLHYDYRNPLKRFLYLWLERFLTPMARFVVNVSKSQEKEGIRLGIFQKDKSKVVVNGIDSGEIGVQRSGNRGFRKKLGIEEKDFAVAMVARFDEVKGHMRFINLIPSLVEAVPNLKIVFAGGGKGEKDMRQLARKFGVSDSTIFLGERKDIPKILQAVDAVVLPSYHEGLPISVLEASATGLPVIGSDVVGIKDTIRDGETGILADFDNPKAVVGSFKKLAKSPTLRRRMGERGRDFVEKEFSMEKFVDSTLRVYQQALREQGNQLNG